MSGKLLMFLSHPIQHYTPWFAALHQRLGGRLKVVFACRHGLDASMDREFGQKFAWDMDLLAGYESEFYGEVSAGQNPGGGFWGIRFPGIGEFLERERPRAVMIFGWLYKGYWEVANAARRLGIPYFMRAESNLLNTGPGVKWWVKYRVVGRLCRNAAGCIAIGSRNADLYRAYDVAERRIKVAPYFVDNEWFSHQADLQRPKRKQLRQMFGLPEEGIVFLFMGKMIRKKHPDHLLDAWQGLPGDLKGNSGILFGGSGKMLESLKARAGTRRVAFPGFLNRRQLPEAYAASDALVLPSDEGETWGLVVNEAMASGLPVLVSDRVGCAPDLVLHGKTGYEFPFGDVDALGRCLENFICAGEERLAMGEAARRHVAAASVQHSVDVLADEFENM